jgi:hypothetical protein
MRIARDTAILTALIALFTWLLGWWTVPVLAGLAAAFDRDRRTSIVKVTVAAALAWALVLLAQGLLGSSVTALGGDLATSLAVPRMVPLALTLLLPALLAASMAGTVVGVKRWRERARLSTPL